MKTQRQRVTLWAWEFTRQHSYTWSQAMKKAWKEIKLRDLNTALAHNTVRVSFMKVNYPGGYPLQQAYSPAVCPQRDRPG